MRYSSLVTSGLHNESSATCVFAFGMDIMLDTPLEVNSFAMLATVGIGSAISKKRVVVELEMAREAKFCVSQTQKVMEFRAQGVLYRPARYNQDHHSSRLERRATPLMVGGRDQGRISRSSGQKACFTAAYHSKVVSLPPFGSLYNHSACHK